MRRFYSPKESFSQEHVELGTDETRHLRDVLRLRDGEEVLIFDGEGNEYSCEIVEIGKRSAGLRIVSQTEPASPESCLKLNLAVAILKHDRFDLVIQKAVELGVTKLIPLEVKHFDVPIRDALKRFDRWKRIALEATKQCGRARLMQIEDAMNVGDLIKQLNPKNSLMFSERSGTALPSKHFDGEMTAMIGPVGGWDDTELEMAAKYDIPMVTLGGRILRAETAAISIATILQHRFGDLN